jgi:hypothetical protein
MAFAIVASVGSCFPCSHSLGILLSLGITVGSTNLKHQMRFLRTVSGCSAKQLTPAPAVQRPCAADLGKNSTGVRPQSPDYGETITSKHKIQVHFLVLTAHRKEMFLQSALQEFKAKRAERRHQAAENPISRTKRQTSSSRSRPSLDKRPRIPGSKSRA